jgi:hypothetical protein
MLRGLIAFAARRKAMPDDKFSRQVADLQRIFAANALQILLLAK